MAGGNQQGVGAILSINGDTRAMKEFLENIPPAYGQVVPNSQVHLTLVDYRETAIEIVTDRDLIALTNASTRMVEHLGSLPLKQLVFHPAKGNGELRPFGRYLGIEVQKTPEIEQLRSWLGKIVKKEVGIEILDDEENFVPHISTVEQPKNRSRRVKPQGYKPVVPANLHVNGFDVGKRVFPPPQKNHISTKQSYANRPGGLRAGSSLRLIG